MRFTLRTAIPVAGLLLAMSFATLAWACTAQPEVAVLPAASEAAPRNTVEVRGTGFGDGPVAVRWGTEDTQLLAETQGPEFRQVVSLPENLPSGVYYLVVTGPNGAGARAPYEVIQGSASSVTSGVSADLWSGLSSQDPAIAGEATTPDAGRSAFAAGLGLMAVGIGAAGATATVAVVSRRRAHRIAE